MNAKSANDSKVEVITRMFPSDANPAGNVFGGEILKQIDIVAGIVAHRHCRTNVVTASIDRVDFLKPVYASPLYRAVNYRLSGHTLKMI